SHPSHPPLPYTTLFRSFGSILLHGDEAAAAEPHANLPEDSRPGPETSQRMGQRMGQCKRRNPAREPLPLRSGRIGRSSQGGPIRSEEHTSELQSRGHLV